jgi:ABC-type transport system involved in multi-copper enzyme maturation permease subunit
VSKDAFKPSFVGALRGVWLFTWRSQLTWRRVPGALARLLVLPFLIFITTLSADSWSARHSVLGKTDDAVRTFASQLDHDQRLSSQQTRDLKQIFGEEFARAEQEAREIQSTNLNSTWQNDLVRDTYRRITPRARSVLDVRQAATFEAFARQTISSTYQREPRWNRTTSFYMLLISLYFTIIIPLTCVRASGALIRDELQADTIGFLLTRPMTRARLVIVKYLSQTAWLQAVFFLQALLIFAAGHLRHVPNLGSLVPLFLGAQVLAVLVWSGLGVLLGLLASRYMAAALFYGFVVEMGIGRIPTNINTLSMMRHLKTLLAHNSTLQTIYDWPTQTPLYSVGAVLIGAGVFLALGAILFTFFEYHHTAEMQK